MRLARMAAVWAAGLWVGLAGPSGCKDRAPAADGGPPDASDAAAADAAPDGGRDATVWDAGPDAVNCGIYYGRVRPLPWPPEPEQYDFCGQTFFKLPVDIWEQGTICSVHLHGDRLLYRAWNASRSPRLHHVYVFDLADCRQYLVAWQQPQDATIAALSPRGDKLAAEWSLPCPDSPPNFFVVDLDTWEREQVTFDDTRVGSSPAAFTGRYLGADTAWKLPDGGLLEETRVLDVETGAEEVVADAHAFTDYMYATEDLLAWIEFGDRGTGRWAVWYDPTTGDKHVVEQTVPEYQEYDYIQGTKLVGHWGETYQQGPYHIWTYDVAEDRFEEVRIEQAPPFPVIWGNVMALLTNNYAPDPRAMYPTDILLVDLETGLERRVTTEPGWVYLPGGFDPPWLAIGVFAGRHHHAFWVLNVYQAGLIDADGHVIPGDPVIDPPSPDD